MHKQIITRLRGRAILLLLLLLSLASCQGGRWHLFGLSAEEEERLCLDLNLADSLMENNADSAMSILRHDSVLAHRADKEERMMYALLKTQADDKLNITHQSDSTIREVANYFSKHGNARQQAQAWYLLGRVSYELHHTSSAIFSFRQALDVEAQEAVVYRYKMQAASWLGAIYEKEKMYKELLNCNQQAYLYAKKSDSPWELTVYALRDIGRSYSYLKNNKDAIIYYKKAVKVAKLISDERLSQKIEEELAAIYLEEKMLSEAGQILLRPVIWISKDEQAPYYYTKGKYYEAVGNIDSAVSYYKKNIIIASMYSKTNTIAHLVELYERLGNYTEVHRYRVIGKKYADSLVSQKQVELHDNNRNLEEKVEIEKQNNEQNRNSCIIIVSSCVLGIGMVILIFILSHRYKRRNTILTNENKRITGYYKNIRSKDSNKIIQLKKQNEVLKIELDSISSHLSKTNAKTENMVEITGEKNLLVEEFVNSSIYALFHKVNFVPKAKDFQLLEKAINRTYNNFTVRLRQQSSKLDEKDICICCLLKAEVPLKIISLYLNCSYSNLSTRRSRLYKKLQKRSGSAEELDALIILF